MQSESMRLISRLSNLVASRDTLAYTQLQSANMLDVESSVPYDPSEVDHSYGIEEDDYAERVTSEAENELRLGTFL